MASRSFGPDMAAHPADFIQYLALAQLLFSYSVHSFQGFEKKARGLPSAVPGSYHSAGGAAHVKGVCFQALML